MSELGLKLEAICEKLRDAYFKILIEELYNKIKQDKDFKALMEKHDVENEEQIIFEGLLYSNIKKILKKDRKIAVDGEMAEG